MSISFKINGKPTSVDVPDDMPLLWVLRDVLDLKGTKFGCGVAQCGACTVQVNGTPIRSCQRRASTVAGTEVTTVEGLSVAAITYYMTGLFSYLAKAGYESGMLKFDPSYITAAFIPLAALTIWLTVRSIRRRHVLERSSTD